MRRPATVMAWLGAGILLIAGVVFWVGVRHSFGARVVSVGGPPASADACGVSGDWGGGSALFRVWVDADPGSVTAVWWPTMNDADCHPRETSGGRAQAEALAGSVRTAPKPLTGRVNCPNDVGGAVDLYFSYENGKKWERVRVFPTGCAIVTARGRQNRQWLGDGTLAELTPPGEWKSVLR